MLKKTITYENPFTGQSVTEEHYFHISKSNLVEMEMEEHKDRYVAQTGEDAGKELTGMRAKLQRIAEAEDGKAILEQLRDFIRRAYGKKEGERFVKTQAAWEEFQASEAFSELLFELSTDAEKAAEFINGIVPSNMDQIAAEVAARAEAQQAALAARGGDGATVTPIKPPEAAPADPTGLTNPTTPRVLTQAEVQAMDANELQAGLADGRYKLS